MKIEHASEWLEFQRFAAAWSSQVVVEPEFSFRGQSNSSWGLRSSLLRTIGVSGASDDDLIGIETECLRAFQEVAHLHLPLSILPEQHEELRDRVAWWTLMQHFGAPTRLLDWTSSIYVALYFAVIENPKEDGVVFATVSGSIDSLNRKVAQKWFDFDGVGAPQSLMFIQRRRTFDRIAAQQGCFSLSHNVSADHGQILEKLWKSAPEEQHSFSKLIVPASLKPDFLRRLRLMNITASSLFPGIDGVGRSLKELVKALSE